MFQPPLNNIVVSVKTKHVKNVSKIMLAANINPANTLEPLDLVQIVGKIEALPKEIDTKKREYKGYSLKDIKVGDICIFRSDVIGDCRYDEETDLNHYRNMVYYGLKEYFLVDIQRLFAIIRDEEIIMINSFVMIEQPQENTIVLPQTMKRITKASRVQVLHIGNPKEGQKGLDVDAGDFVYLNKNKCTNYSIGDKKFAITTQEHLLGKEVFDVTLN